MGYRPLEEKEWLDVFDRYTDVPIYPSVDELLTMMQEEGIPLSAQIVYHGCGSHTLALEWGDE